MTSARVLKKAKSERKKRSGTSKKSQAPHPRHLRRLIAQERFPVLSRGSFWTNLPHILLDRPFTHPNIQLEKLTPNALRAPESVMCRHLLDQRDRLGGESLLTRGRLRFVLPEHAEELTRPSQKRRLPGQERATLSRSEPSWLRAPGEAAHSSGMLVASLVDAG